MKIESVKKNDAKKLLEIYAYYVKETAVSFEYEIPSVKEFKKRIKTISKKFPYIKAVDKDENIVGYAYANTFKSRSAYDWSVETTIYVKKDCRKNGIGKALYNELEIQLKKMGILNMNACIAFTNSEDSHLTNASVFFHEKMDFKTVGTFHKIGYKFNTWYDMVWMEKFIGEHKSLQSPVKFVEQLL